jgi:nicotinate phosphoribosyltransferase
MPHLRALYRPSLALATDFYQLTVAAAALEHGLAGREAAFTLSFRRAPFGGGFALAAGLETALELVEGLRFDEEDLAFLAAQRDARGAPLFRPEFVAYLRRLELAVDVDAVPEGTPVFPHEPLLRVRGPVVACMLLETPLLAILNFQTLVATKAARVVRAARGEPVLEFGLRRAQGLDGGVSASRAAYVGGCAGTSNVLAGRLLGIPVKGTHAHSWVMLFGDEQEAFDAWARAMPGNCTLLVDTYDSLDGVRRAVETGRRLRAMGGELQAVRLDSGDLAWLSREARRILDEGGFPGTKVLATNELDEHIVESLKEQGAAIALWAVGTRLVTGAPDAALGGVYKMGAVRAPGGAWEHRVKLSERSEKTSIPGVLQIRRFRGADGAYVADVVWDELLGVAGEGPGAPPGDGAITMVDPLDHTRRRTLPGGQPSADLLAPVLRGGRPLAPAPPLAAVRAHALRELDRLPAGVRRFVNPHEFPVGLERGLFDLRTRMILAARGEGP